jgi:O-antigen/teichoic acid export membrane protein
LSESKKRTAGKSFLFKFAESAGTQGIAFVVGILLARLLDPADYGVLAILMVFVNVRACLWKAG